MENLTAYMKVAAVLLPLVLQAGTGFIAFLENLKKVYAKGEPSEDDWAALRANEDRLRAILQAPLPPEDQA
jgi:hypothetical protein